VSKKYVVRDKYGRRVGTFEPLSDPTGCLVAVVIITLMLTIGFAFLPVLFGLWLALNDEKRQSYWLKGLWVVSCFLVAFVLAWLLGQSDTNWEIWLIPLIIYVPIGAVGAIIVMAQFTRSRLTDTLTKRERGFQALRHCPKCGAMTAARDGTCGACGYVFP
jgi:hypothetical protein